MLHGVKNPLDWWKTSEGMFPKMARMARDTYAVPATSSGVEREFSISGNIVNNRRNRLSPKTISDLMQYKRWLAKTGVMTKFLRDQGSTDMEMDSENEEEDDNDELNQELIDWLDDWEKSQTLQQRAQALEPVG